MSNLQLAVHCAAKQARSHHAQRPLGRRPGTFSHAMGHMKVQAVQEPIVVPVKCATVLSGEHGHPGSRCEPAAPL